MLDQPLILFVDLFCGAGGTTSGVENSFLSKRKLAKVIMCVNHDKNAINSHFLNHPQVKHFTEDIRTLDLRKMISHLKLMRKLYPNAKLALWASLECINFSKAKGGQSRDADSRTLANSLFRYILALNPDYIFIENVSEFLDWGPLRVKQARAFSNFTQLAVDKTGKLIYVPVQDKKGTDFKVWKDTIMNEHGYKCEHKVMNCADYGLRTIRKRLFMQFAKKDLPIQWPEKTHNKKGPLKPWLPVRPLLDLHEPGDSLFGVKTSKNGKTRLRFESPKTRERILAGCKKYTTPFIASTNGLDTGQSHECKIKGVDEPGAAVLTKVNKRLVSPVPFLMSYYTSGGNLNSVESPGNSATTKDRQSIVRPVSFLQSHYSSNTPKHLCSSLDEPGRTVKTKDSVSIVNAVPFVLSHYSSPPYSTSKSVDECGKTVTTSGSLSVVQAIQFMDLQFSGPKNHSSLDEPCKTVMPNGSKMNIVETVPFIHRAFTNGGNLMSVDDPAGAVMSHPKMDVVTPQPFLMDMQFANSGYNVDTPSPTVIAHQNKKPLYLITAVTGEFALCIYDNDSPETIALKKWMAENGICDIMIRMLKKVELLRIQDFPDNYILVGTEAEQKKFIGNAVPPGIAMLIIAATANELLQGTVFETTLYSSLAN